MDRGPCPFLLLSRLRPLLVYQTPMPGFFSLLLLLLLRLLLLLLGLAKCSWEIACSQNQVKRPDGPELVEASLPGSQSKIQALLQNPMMHTSNQRYKYTLRDAQKITGEPYCTVEIGFMKEERRQRAYGGISPQINHLFVRLR